MFVEKSGTPWQTQLWLVMGIQPYHTPTLSPLTCTENMHLIQTKQDWDNHRASYLTERLTEVDCDRLRSCRPRSKSWCLDILFFPFHFSLFFFLLRQKIFISFILKQQNTFIHSERHRQTLKLTQSVSPFLARAKQILAPALTFSAIKRWTHIGQHSSSMIK